VNIAFANELSVICHELDIDIRELTRLANRHPRVSILDAGIGVGGHCIAVDPWFIAAEFPEKTRLIQGARQVNLDKTEWVINRIRQEADALGELLGKAPKIALLGLAYKPNVADLRESPACQIAHALTDDKRDIICVEPHAKSVKGLKLVSLDEACGNADMAVVLVRHEAFSGINDRATKPGAIFDFCGLVTGA
jgi:UDP-N-acetyl-D-mannosaminuronic acid dehydrogenase